MQMSAAFSVGLFAVCCLRMVHAEVASKAYLMQYSLLFT